MSETAVQACIGTCACVVGGSEGEKLISHRKQSVRTFRALIIRVRPYMHTLQAEGTVAAAKMSSFDSRAATQVSA